MISDDAFRIIVEGVAALSLHTRRFENPAALFEYAIANDLHPNDAEISIAKTIATDGDNRIPFSTLVELNTKVDDMRDNLLNLTGKSWLLREILVVLALTISKRFSGLR